MDVIRVDGLENSEITLDYPRGPNLNTESGRAENFLGLEVERNVAEGGNQRACKHEKDFPGCCWLCDVGSHVPRPERRHQELRRDAHVSREGGPPSYDCKEPILPTP